MQKIDHLDIVESLKNNKEFITETTDESEFYDYIDFIDSYKATFNKDDRILRFTDFIKNHGRNKTVKAVLLKHDEEEEEESIEIQDQTRKVTTKTEKNSSAKNDETQTISSKTTINIKSIDMNTISQKIEEESTANIDKNCGPQKVVETAQYEIKGMLYPESDFYSLKLSCQELVEEAINDSFKQFLVGKSLIEGLNGFPTNINLGVKYIEESNKGKCIDSIIYLSRMLIQGDTIDENLERAIQLLSNIKPNESKQIFSLRGLISLKQNKYSESVKYFSEGVKYGDIESMYEYGKMHFIGEGIKLNIKESLKYMQMTKDQGYKKRRIFCDNIR